MDRVESDFKIDAFESDGTFAGYGSVFNVTDSHKDVVAPGSFSASIADAKRTGNWPALYLMHQFGDDMSDKLPIGSWLNMREDSTGLWCEGKLALGNTKANDVHALMRLKPRPALNGLSIGFRPRHFTVHKRGEKANGALRTIHDVDLVEVSVVDRPSNPLARVSSVKSNDDAGERFTRALRDLRDMVRGNISHEKREFESDLRRWGYSRETAKRMTAERFA